ncbi:hypothetical protein F0562_023823 [Nyssa sinensis]|uniref:Uncharacterized protein n=1 Tax=Nyssa sinensis TaxID=561372 RepID=A0A5J5BJA5_9ASTE|nr:hypothetical protein F0562_023823 [Nyssa sinensis]
MKKLKRIVQITREIESEIVKCSETESALAVRESELMKMVYMAEFEIDGLMAVTADSRTSVKLLDEELCHLRMKSDEKIKRMNNKREGFTTSCLDFQRTIDKGENNELDNLLLEKKSHEKDIYLLSMKYNDLQNSMLVFVEEIIEDLHSSNFALLVEIQNGKFENEKLLKDINVLKTTLLSAISFDNDQ